MPKRGKKGFNKKQAERFVLLHRSRDDPDYDESASSQFVLLNPESREAIGVGGDGQTTRTDESKLARHAQTRVEGLAVAEVDEFGFPLDGYDYSQHLASIGGGTFMNSFGERMAVHTEEDSGYTSDMLSDAGSVCSAPDYDLDGMLPSITLGGQEMSAELKEALELLEEADKDDTLVYSGSGGAPPPSGGKRVKGDAVTVAEAPAEAISGAAAAAADGGALPDSRAARKKKRPKAQNVADFEMLNDDFMLQAAGEKDASNWEIVNPHEIINAPDLDSKFGLAGGVAAAVKASAPSAAMSDEAAAAFIEQHQAAMLQAASEEAAAAEAAGAGAPAAAAAGAQGQSALDAHIAKLMAAAGDEEEDIDAVFAAQEAAADAAEEAAAAAAAAAAPAGDSSATEGVKYVRLSESGFDWDAHVARLMANARGQMEDLDDAVADDGSESEDSDEGGAGGLHGGASESKFGAGMPVNGHGTTVSATAAAAAAAQARGYADSQFFKQFVAQYDDDLIGPGVSDDEGSFDGDGDEGDEEEEDLEFESLEALQAKYGLADVEGMGMELGSDDEEDDGEGGEGSDDEGGSDGEEGGARASKAVPPGGPVKIGDKVEGYGTVIQTPLHGRSMAGANALLEAAIDEFSSQRVSIEELFAGAYRGTAEEHAAAKKAAAAKKRRAALAAKAAAEEEEEEDSSDEEDSGDEEEEEADADAEDDAEDSGSEEEDGDDDEESDDDEDGDEVTELPGGGVAPGSKPVPYGFGAEDAVDEDPVLDRHLFRPKVKAQWDVDTVISTYSNLDNHPQQLSTRGPSSVATGSRRRRGPNSVASRGTDSGVAPHLLQERTRGRRGAGATEADAADAAPAPVPQEAKPAQPPVPPSQSMAFSISLPGASAPAAAAAASSAAPVAARAASPSAGSADEAADEVGSLPSDHPSDDSYDSDDGNTMMSSQMSRRGETPEERKQRKAAVKAVRKARRQHKAAMRAAFKEQEKALLTAQNKAKEGAASAAGHAVFRIG